MKPYRLSRVGYVAAVGIAIAFVLAMFVIQNIIALTGATLMLIAFGKIVREHQLLNELYHLLCESPARDAAYAFVLLSGPLDRQTIARKREVSLATVDELIRKLYYVGCLKSQREKDPDKERYSLTDKGRDLFQRAHLFEPKST